MSGAQSRSDISLLEKYFLAFVITDFVLKEKTDAIPLAR